MKMAVGLFLLIFGLSLGYFVNFHVVEFGAPGFRYIPWKTTINGKPFSGVTYKFHEQSWNIYKIQFFWQGRQELTEYRWFSDGVKWQEMSFVRGLREGPTKNWYPTGKVQTFKNYSGDKLNGEVWGWHPNGEVSDYHVFQMGEQIVYKSFISDGKPYFNYVYRNGERVGMQGGDYCKTQRVSEL